MRLIMILGILIGNLFFMFAIERFMRVFFSKRRTSFKIMVASYFLYFVLATLQRLLVYFTEIYLPHVLVVSLTLMIITLNYEASMAKRLVAVACNYGFFALVVISVENTVFFLLPLTVDEFMENLTLLSWSYVMSAVFSYLLAISLGSFKNIRKNSSTVPKLWWTIPFVQVSMIVAFVYVPEHLLPLSFLLNMIVLFGTNLFILYLYNSISGAHEEKLKSALQAQEKEYYLSQSQLMQKSAEQIKAFQHDIRNHLMTLKAYTTKGDVKDAAHYLDKLLGHIEESETYSDTGNVAFDSVINDKFKDAQHTGIQLDLALSIPQKLNIEATDIVTILGNLLDNALDAIHQVDDKWIKLRIEFSKGCLFIKLENPFNGEVSYLEEMGQPTTLKLEEGHGYGLKNITQSINHYNGEMKIIHTDHVFSIIVFLYINEM